MKTVNLNIYSFGVMLEDLPLELAQKLEKDFTYFISAQLGECKRRLTLRYHTQTPQDLIPSGLVAKKQTENSVYYERGEIRFNDYYGEAITKFNYSTENCDVFCQDLNFAHELIYLIVLSRSAKYLDKKGLHKIHACAVSKKNRNLILMMPSKGGKSTHLCHLLKDENINLISDDTPVVNTKGEILPFPLRLGLESAAVIKEFFPYIEEKDLVDFQRKKYPKKTLLSYQLLKNQIKVGHQNILVVGFRSTFDKPRLEKISRFSMLKYLIEHMVVGIGLPLIIEYFLRHNFKDHVINVKNFFSRLRSAIKLILDSENYRYYSSPDFSENTKLLKSLLHD